MKSAVDSRTKCSALPSTVMLSIVYSSARSSWIRPASSSMRKRNDVAAGDRLCNGITRSVELIVEQIVVGAIWPIGSAQHLRAVRCGALRCESGKRGGSGRWQHGTRGLLCGENCANEHRQQSKEAAVRHFRSLPFIAPQRGGHGVA